MKMIPACCTRSTAARGDALHVDQLLLLFLRERLERRRDVQPAFPRLALEEPGSMSLTLMSTSSTDEPGDDLE